MPVNKAFIQHGRREVFLIFRSKSAKESMTFNKNCRRRGYPPEFKRVKGGTDTLKVGARIAIYIRRSRFLNCKKVADTIFPSQKNTRKGFPKLKRMTDAP